MARFFLFVLMFLPSCASVEYALPSVAETTKEEARVASIRAAYDAAVARRARVYDLAWPVLTASTELCPTSSPSIGVILADRESHATLAGDLREDDMASFGVPDAVHLYHVHAGSPAAEAGLHRGDVLTEINGKTIDTPEAASKLIRKATKADNAVKLTIQRNGIETVVETAATARCEMAVKIAPTQALNASAGTGDIVMYQGLINALSDNALQFVIAHEAAHLAARHPRKYKRNLLVSGAVVAGPVVYTAAWIVDSAGGVVGHDPDVSLRSRALRAIAPWTSEFEAEADYLGAFFHARAGGDVRAARETFDVFAREAPKSIYARATHPLVPERLAALAAVADEIDALRAAGAPLLPRRVGDSH